MLEFLEDTPVGSRSSVMARARLGERESVGQVSEGEEGEPGPPSAVFFLCLFPLSYFHLFSFVWRFAGSSRKEYPSMTLSGWG